MKPSVSVLMPVFNGADLIAGCLEGILSQTMRDFELIVVNDGSDDGGGEILARFASGDSRIRIIEIEHGGIVKALNRGLEACSGDFIARMDIDDRMRGERLARQAGYMESHPGCDLCGAWVKPYGIGKEISPGGIKYHNWLNTMESDLDIKTGLFVDSPIAHSTFFVKKELYHRVGGYRDCDWAEDYDFILRANQEGAKFGNVPQVLLERGDRPGRLTRVDPRYKRKAMFRAKAHYFARGKWLNGKSGIVIAGSGPSGRIMAEVLGDVLTEKQAPLLGFIDNKSGPPDRTVMGFPARNYQGIFSGKSPADQLGDLPDDFPGGLENSFCILCIGDDAGRQEVVSLLEAAGWQEGRDFLRFI